MQVTNTSTQRTYRYVRLSIVGAVVLLFTALAITSSRDGFTTSISAGYYTPAGDIFVGVIFAVTLALIALSGHSVEQALLDYAAIVAPLVAIVPTPILTGDVPGLVVDCPDAAPCVPAGSADIGVGIWSLLVLGALGVAAAFVLALAQRILTTAVGLALAVAASIVLAVGLWWALSPATFLLWGHVTATGTFFGLIAAVAGIAAWGVGKGASDASRPAVYRTLYVVIASGILVAVAFLVFVLVARLNGLDVAEASGLPLVFIGEAVALTLFAAFWLIQTIEKWDEVNPTLRAA